MRSLSIVTLLLFISSVFAAPAMQTTVLERSGFPSAGSQSEQSLYPPQRRRRSLPDLQKRQYAASEDLPHVKRRQVLYRQLARSYMKRANGTPEGQRNNLLEDPPHPEPYPPPRRNSILYPPTPPSSPV
ncbi:hypothetical protein AX14_001129 [Amanita brunnescens Koide BX004]|nr:hypothetical protein AX14_001129 [Amanita brunnescens Koide BX004]